MIDLNLLIQVATEFESGVVTVENPFSPDAPDYGSPHVLTPLQAFVDGYAVPETAEQISRLAPPDATPEEIAGAFAMAGVLQGLILGWEYAQRKPINT